MCCLSNETRRKLALFVVQVCLWEQLNLLFFRSSYECIVLFSAGLFAHFRAREKNGRLIISIFTQPNRIFANSVPAEQCFDSFFVEDLLGTNDPQSDILVVIKEICPDFTFFFDFNFDDRFRFLLFLRLYLRDRF